MVGYKSKGEGSEADTEQPNELMQSMALATCWPCAELQPIGLGSPLGHAVMTEMWLVSVHIEIVSLLETTAYIMFWMAPVVG